MLPPLVQSLIQVVPIIDVPCHRKHNLSIGQVPLWSGLTPWPRHFSCSMWPLQWQGLLHQEI